MESANISEVVKNLDSPDESRRKMAAFRLQSTMGDPAFANAFVSEGGLPKLQALTISASGNTLSYALASFASLLDLDQGWDYLSPDLISRMIDLVVGQPLVNILRGAMAILAHVVSHPTRHPSSKLGMRALEPAIFKHPQFLEILVSRMSSADHALCANALQLINALVRDAVSNNSDGEWPRFVNRLQDLGVVRAVYGLMQAPALQQELAGPVLEFQGLMKIMLRRWREVKVTRSKPEHRRALREINRAGKIGLGEKAPMQNASVLESDADAWRTLGFEGNEPLEELQETGYLGLIDLLEYIRKNEDGFHMQLLEQAGLPPQERCPLAKASMAVTSVLYDHFEIDASDADLPRPGFGAQADFRTRMGFDKLARPFLLQWNHLHASAVKAFVRLWSAAGAERADFGKLDELARILVERTLSLASRTKPLSEVDDELARFELPALRELQMELIELTHDDRWGNHLRQIKDELHSEALQFVKEQRVRCLLHGAWFRSTASEAAAGGWRFVRLSHNRRYLHHADFPLPQGAPDVDSLSSKIALTSITSVVSNTVPATPTTPQTTTIAIHGRAERPLSTASASSASSADAAPALLTLHVPPRDPNGSQESGGSQHLASELLDALLLLLNQSPITDATLRLVSFVARYGVRIRLLNVAGESGGVAKGAFGRGGGGVEGGAGAGKAGDEEEAEPDNPPRRANGTGKGGAAAMAMVLQPDREGVDDEFFYDMSVF